MRHRQHELITNKDEISVLATNIVDKEFKKIGFSAEGNLQQRDTPSVSCGSIVAPGKSVLSVHFLQSRH
jgi:hypothetical protein